MLSEISAAAFLGVCLATFYLVNLFNLLRNRVRRRAQKVQEKPKPEASEPPRTILLGLAAVGTFVFWLGSIFYVLLAFTGVLPSFNGLLLPLGFQFDSWAQIAGIILTGFGYFLFVWSVVARGRYAIAWDMPQDHRLVTWGPYRYIRHPSYVSYFVMFFGLFLIWLTWIALVPLMAIPGYVKIVGLEEKILTRKFGEEYTSYQKSVGKFFPKLRINKEQRPNVLVQ
jgi:protein-S-isoprenylcysteine O-methyltransferase Ste14